MAKITRKTQRIFAGDVPPTGIVAQFGSLKAAAPLFSSDPDIIQALAAFGLGWDAALINAPGGNASPAKQDDNAIKFLVTRQLAYLLQAGIAEWDAGTPYFLGSWCTVAGVPFVSLTDNNLNNLVTDTNNWIPYAKTLTTDGAAKGWVCFNGTGATGAKTINSQFNVASVIKSAVGIYQVNFNVALANANYAINGSCGTPNGSAFFSGDDNVVTTGWAGRVGVKTTAGFVLYCVDPKDRVLEDSQAISVNIFATS